MTTTTTPTRDLRRVADKDGTIHDLSRGYVVYDGPSMIDGTPILGIITTNSTNEKTGNMSQLWILVRNTHPTVARETREDRGICGDCPVWEICYVITGFGPAAVHRAFNAGVYETGLPPEIAKGLRLGAYGDPAALPVRVIRKAVALFRGRTGYTHQWRKKRVQAMREYCMASVETLAGYHEAVAQGWRTFRVILRVEDLQPGEIICPATPEGGNKTLCEHCMLCSGNNEKTRGVKNIAAVAHGGKATTDRLIQIMGVAA